ncbi:hypothetical protein JB92DRAFT_3034880 [Gautieria morchelliformis]|nr:hypothetical protein JB92DRAFT_3034880 [Gautieria morchelliformis]
MLGGPAVPQGADIAPSDQSAVLHALLAQSRCPTTAMREEVGRSIGVSPRKVQGWLQNQRQKARKLRQDTSTVGE